jgi:hypothetical protein
MRVPGRVRLPGRLRFGAPARAGAVVWAAGYTRVGPGAVLACGAAAWCSVLVGSVGVGVKVSY